MDSIQNPSGLSSLPRISVEDARKKRLLSGEDLHKLHLVPHGAPVACTMCADGSAIYHYDPNRVEPAPPEREPRLSPLDPPRRMRLQNAVKQGYFPIDSLRQMYYEPTEGPVAFYVKNGEEVPLYDKTTCRRLPLPCARCGDPVRYRLKLCRRCYDAHMAERRAEGDARRNAVYGMDRRKVLFFDLEMTGFYFHDEVLSITLTNGAGEPVFDSLVRPVRKKKWKRTEEIHGITPDMVKDAPTFEELGPRLREIFAAADAMVAYGTATDFFHLSHLYGTRAERDALHDKILDCGTEFSHYVQEHEIELGHHSLSDAMAHFGLSWKGAAHTSAADTDACRRVFEVLFPHYFKEDI